MTLTLAQPDLRKDSRAAGQSVDYIPIGLTVVLMKPGAGPQLTKGSEGEPPHYELIHRTSFWNKRDTSCEIVVPIASLTNPAAVIEGGAIIVVPSTFNPGEEGKFTLSASVPRQALGGALATCQPTLRPIDFRERFHATSLQGAWKGPTACGRLGTGANAKHNTIYALRFAPPPEKAEVDIFIFLSQPQGGTRKSSKPRRGSRSGGNASAGNNAAKKPDPFLFTGTYVFQGWSAARQIKQAGEVTDNSATLGKFAFQNRGVVSRKVTLPVKKSGPAAAEATEAAVHGEEDSIILLVPCAAENGDEGEYTLEVMSADAEVSLEVVENVPAGKPQKRSEAKVAALDDAIPASANGTSTEKHNRPGKTRKRSKGEIKPSKPGANFSKAKAGMDNLMGDYAALGL